MTVGRMCAGYAPSLPQHSAHGRGCRRILGRIVRQAGHGQSPENAKKRYAHFLALFVTVPEGEKIYPERSRFMCGGDHLAALAWSRE
jgi:hypothetical protein